MVKRFTQFGWYFEQAEAMVFTVISFDMNKHTSTNHMLTLGVHEISMLYSSDHLDLVARGFHSRERCEASDPMFFRNGAFGSWDPQACSAS